MTRQRLWTPLSSAVLRRFLSPFSSYASTNSAIQSVDYFQKFGLCGLKMEKNSKRWCNSFANAFQDQNFGEAVKCVGRMKYYGRVVKEIVKRL